MKNCNKKVKFVNFLKICEVYSGFYEIQMGVDSNAATSKITKNKRYNSLINGRNINHKYIVIGGWRRYYGKQN
mgnify:CR=1 FL=1